MSSFSVDAIFALLAECVVIIVQQLRMCVLVLGSFIFKRSSDISSESCTCEFNMMMRIDRLICDVVLNNSYFVMNDLVFNRNYNL